MPLGGPMRRSRFLQFLSIPAVLSLGTAFVLACGESGATAPDAPEVAPAFRKYGPTDASAFSLCIEGQQLTQVKPGTSVDKNRDGWICK